MKNVKHALLGVGSATALLLCGAAVLVTTVAPRTAAAQNNPTYSNVIPQAAAVRLQARIDAIDPKGRQVTLTGRNGQKVTVEAGPMVRLELLKVGDTVNVTYYRSVAFAVSPSGTQAPGDEMRMALARKAKTPGGAAVSVTRISGLIVGIDLAAHSLDLVPTGGGGVITVQVTDPARQAAMSGLKVGDTLTAVVSESLAVTIEPATQN